jgi:hypothetical protein
MAKDTAHYPVPVTTVMNLRTRSLNVDMQRVKKMVT